MPPKASGALLQRWIASKISTIQSTRMADTLSQQAAEIQAATGTVIPAYNGTQTSWVKSTPNFHLQSFIDELAYSVPYPVSKNTAAWDDAETKILTQVWAGQTSLDAGASQLAQ